VKKAMSLIAIIGIFTVALAFGCYLVYTRILETSNPPGCAPLPVNFSEADLVGTWEAGWPGHTDTLVIKADGSYKQTVHVEFVDRSRIDYESDWQPWHIEYSEDNNGYLHLREFRFCGMNSEIPCEKRVGGGYDFCRDETIKMDNEGILLVLATRAKESLGTDEPLYDIHLAYPLGYENSWIYTRQAP
jgi:hypothetical protein